jgi:hypothetical protein
MYSIENYIWGLVAYLLGFLMMLPLGWKLTGFIPWSWPRRVLRTFLFALFLTPVKAYPDVGFLAPAWVVAAFELFQPSSELGALRALVPILVVFVVLLAALVAWHLRWRPGRQNIPSTQRSEPEF